MAEDLKNLLERIQRDGVEKAETEAARIRREAEAARDRILAEARDEAAAITGKAKTESLAYEQRARQAIEQAGRDVVLSVGESIMRTLTALIGERVEAALDADTLKNMLVAIVQAYAARTAGEASGTAATAIDVILPPALQKDVGEKLLGALSESLRGGMQIRGDGRVISGFRVSARDGHVEHDFSGDAITEAMSQLLRPKLAELLRNATKPDAEA